MSMTDTVAVIGAMTGAVVGGGGLAFGWWNAAKERKERARLSEESRLHDRRMAQDIRLYSSRSQVYEEMLYALGLVQLYIEQTLPRPGHFEQLLSEPPLPETAGEATGLSKSATVDPIGRLLAAPMEGPTNEELLRLTAKIAAFGSATIQEHVEAYLRTAHGLARRAAAARRALAHDYAPEVRTRLREGFPLLQEAWEAAAVVEDGAAIMDADSAVDVSRSAHVLIRINDVSWMPVLLRDLSEIPSVEDQLARIDYLLEQLRYDSDVVKHLCDQVHRHLQDQLESEEYDRWLQSRPDTEDRLLARENQMLRNLLGDDYPILEGERESLQATLRTIQQRAREELATPSELR